MKSLHAIFLLLIITLITFSCSKETVCEMNNTSTVIINNESNSCTLFIRLDKDFPRGAAVGFADYTVSSNSSESIEIPAGQHELYSLYGCYQGNLASYSGGYPAKEVDLDSCEETSVFFVK